LSKFTADTPQETTRETGEETEGQNNDTGPSTSSEGAATPTTSTREGPEPSWSTQALFSRLQSALPPNIVATVQNNIPESLKHASENIDLQQMRTNLLSELQRVQGVTLAQAEEYAHKSEALLREAVKEAGEVLRDAVKVVPPDEAGSSAGGSGLVWDGTDMWMLPFDPSESTPGKEKEGGRSSRLAETQRAVATRAEALLRRLKTDPTILRHNPEVEEGIKDQYAKWRELEADKLDGSAEWQARIDAALKDVDGQALTQLEELLGNPPSVPFSIPTTPNLFCLVLVPSEIPKDTFWLRFFFRTYQIRLEEEKRKALIHSSLLLLVWSFLYSLSNRSFNGE